VPVLTPIFANPATNPSFFFTDLPLLACLTIGFVLVLPNYSQNKTERKSMIEKYIKLIQGSRNLFIVKTGGDRYRMQNTFCLEKIFYAIHPWRPKAICTGPVFALICVTGSKCPSFLFRSGPLLFSGRT
jgi:hypothetical protein